MKKTVKWSDKLKIEIMNAAFVRLEKVGEGQTHFKNRNTCIISIEQYISVFKCSAIERKSLLSKTKTTFCLCYSDKTFKKSWC